MKKSELLTFHVNSQHYLYQSTNVFHQGLPTSVIYLHGCVKQALAESRVQALVTSVLTLIRHTVPVNQARTG